MDIYQQITQWKYVDDPPKTWREISDLLKEVKNTPQGWRGWYRRQKRKMDAVDPASNTSDELANHFGIDQSLYYPRRIKTSQGPNGIEWRSAEWGIAENDEPSIKDFEVIVEMIKEYSPRYHRFNNLLNDGGGEYLFTPQLYDPHIGDSPSNIDAYKLAAAKLIETAQLRFPIDRILFPIGHDFAHFDNVFYQTTKGTQQQPSINWREAIKVQCETAISVIEILAEHAPVDVVIVNGNHDNLSSVWLGQVISAWFHNTDRISVDNTDSNRKYYQWGANMWMLTHGDKDLPGDSGLVGLMAVEAPAMFASSKYREIFMGHLHRKIGMYNVLNEQYGVYFRWFPAIAGRNEWHHMKGYVANRAGIGLVYHSKNMLVDEFPVFI